MDLPAGTADQWGGGGTGAGQTYDYPINLPAGIDCHEVKFPTHSEMVCLSQVVVLMRMGAF